MGKLKRKSSPQCLFLTGKNCSAGVDAGIDGQADHPQVSPLSLADLEGAEAASDALHQSRAERWEAEGNLSRRELSWRSGMALLSAVGSP